MNAAQLRKKLAELNELREELLSRQASMTTAEKLKALAEAQPMVKPGTREHAALLAAGYGMTIEQAKTIIKERQERPELWPYEKFEEAQAMLAAYSAKGPQPSSTRRGWRRSRGR